MEISLDFTEELERELQQVAAVRHTSKESLPLEGVALVIARYDRLQEMQVGLKFVATQDNKLLTKLEDQCALRGSGERLAADALV